MTDLSPPSERIEIQFAVTDRANLPTEAQFRGWSAVALREAAGNDAELVIRLVDENEIVDLNRRFRYRNLPTNVLSFPYESLPGIDTPFLGDVVICAAVVEREAEQQGKAVAAHWAHMVIHGILHLCGYDHMTDDDAQLMEARETEILGALNFPDPYVEL